MILMRLFVLIATLIEPGIIMDGPTYSPRFQYRLLVGTGLLVFELRITYRTDMIGKSRMVLRSGRSLW